MLGKKGIFISDEARDQLNIRLSKDEFQNLKEHINKSENPDELRKCFLTGKMVKTKDGLMLNPEWMANAIEKNLESQSKLWDKYKKDKIVICQNCGTSNIIIGKKILCEKCNKVINVKQYGKSIKLPLAKKISMKLYINI